MSRRRPTVRCAIAASSVALVALIASGLAACSSSTISMRAERTGTISWKPCGSVQCGSLSVPLDAAHPDGAHITLELARHPATGKRIGVLLANPGGPGASGLQFLRDALDLFSANLASAFDIVSWDPRGVGASAPVQCDEQLDEFYALNRDSLAAADIDTDAAETKQFVESCTKNSGPQLPFMSTLDSARDMDAIRIAMGEPTISYLGFSYGTFLGSLYAQEFPAHVRAMVLDGAVDPSVSFEEGARVQALGFEHELDLFVDWCKRNTDCAFAKGGDPKAAFESLQRDIASESLPATVHGEERTLGPGEFDIGVVSALYQGEPGFAGLGAALAQAGRGQGDALVLSSDQYTERERGGKYSNETAALYATSCLDAPAPRLVEDTSAIAARVAQAAPHFGAATVFLGLPCTYWPAPAHQTNAVHAPGVSIVVVGNTSDPATPYTWAQSLTKQLGDARLLTFDASGHTAYGRGNECVDDAINTYFRKLTLPPEGKVCR